MEDAVRLLVTRYMPLNSSDLERWMEDPEEWLNEEVRESDQWEFEIRVSSELNCPGHDRSTLYRHAVNEFSFNWRISSLRG